MVSFPDWETVGDFKALQIMWRDLNTKHSLILQVLLRNIWHWTERASSAWNCIHSLCTKNTKNIQYIKLETIIFPLGILHMSAWFSLFWYFMSIPSSQFYKWYNLLIYAPNVLLSFSMFEFCFHSLLVQYRKRDHKPYVHDASQISDPPLCNSMLVAIGMVWVGI